jgi:sugar phosphate isomerase/epimerase
MISRRDFIIKSNFALAGAFLVPGVMDIKANIENIGVQLYSFRDAMAADARGTLKLIADLGFKQVESARSSKGLYYGLTPTEMKAECESLGLTLRSGHVHLDKDWEKTLDQASEAGQEYVICSSLPTQGQTIDNYKAVAESFNKAGEDCQKRNMKFGYHNHEYEFEMEKGKVLYDVLLEESSPELVHMELDLGWVVVAGMDPMDYFKRFKGRFPLWHLKDMDLWENESTEFGKGGVDISMLIKNREASGVKHIFIEQEEYASNPKESMQHNLKFLADL